MPAQPGSGAVAVDALDLRAGQVHVLAQPGHVAGLQVVGLGHSGRRGARSPGRAAATARARWWPCRPPRAPRGRRARPRGSPRCARPGRPRPSVRRAGPRRCGCRPPRRPARRTEIGIAIGSGRDRLAQLLVVAPEGAQQRGDVGVVERAARRLARRPQVREADVQRAEAPGHAARARAAASPRPAGRRARGAATWRSPARRARPGRAGVSERARPPTPRSAPTRAPCVARDLPGEVAARADRARSAGRRRLGLVGVGFPRARVQAGSKQLHPPMPSVDRVVHLQHVGGLAVGQALEEHASQGGRARSNGVIANCSAVAQQLALQPPASGSRMRRTW